MYVPWLCVFYVCDSSITILHDVVQCMVDVTKGGDDTYILHNVGPPYRYTCFGRTSLHIHLCISYVREGNVYIYYIGPWCHVFNIPLYYT